MTIPVIFLMGPTASGKTALSLELARALDGEIISVDSALVYRGMDIGTAKPSPEERADIPHHLIDILDPSESFSTGQFLSRTHALIDDIQGRGKQPILTGGTMLYFRALSEGLAQLPEACAALRAELERDMAALGSVTMHQKLARIDPEAANRIHPHDPQRIQRALEVYQLTGVPLTDLQRQAQQQQPPWPLRKLILAPSDRAVLHQRIALRFEAMLKKGLIEEVEQLKARGDLSPKNPSIRCVGYRQVWEHLEGAYDYPTLVERGIIATRQLAKRQLTWLRKETAAVWLDGEQTDIAASVLRHLQN
ncbi:MAG: tRNA (adenosine(37)-N6)-dimethylallyltransferase MiaA [Methylococcales bacterium]|nr:tRNA (adenosine(37)-N6)-dimethylallyltransferase MiaA [Methylococcales bacterium]